MFICQDTTLAGDIPYKLLSRRKNTIKTRNFANHKEVANIIYDYILTENVDVIFCRIFILAQDHRPWTLRKQTRDIKDVTEKDISV